MEWIARVHGGFGAFIPVGIRIGPVVRGYLNEFPDMHLNVTVDDRLVDIVGKGFDAGIRYGDRVAQDMVGVALTKAVQWVVVGAQELIARTGRPEAPKDLLELPCVQMRVGDNSNFPWELGNGVAMVRIDVRGPLAANETEHAVRWSAARRWLRLLPGAQGKSGDRVSCAGGRTSGMGLRGVAVHDPSRRQTPPGLRQLMDMIEETRIYLRWLPRTT
jgi:DNA-binding transcriptional LysR family regulator